MEMKGAPGSPGCHRQEYDDVAIGHQNRESPQIKRRVTCLQKART